MKFDQLITYSMGTIFLEKSSSKCGEETRPFSKKSKLNISLDQKSKVSYSLFLLHAKWRAIKLYQNEAADHLLSSLIKLI